MTDFASFIGIDASKDILDVHANPLGLQRRFDNSESGVAEIIAWLKTLPAPLVVLESSGGCEDLAARELYRAGISFSIVNPAQVRQFAKGIGILAKNDRIDAFVLARFGDGVRPRLTEYPDPLKQQLDQAVARRSQLVEMLAVEKTRAHQAAPAVRRNIQSHIRWLEKQIKDYEREIRDLIRSSPSWMEKNDLLQSMPGVGDTTAFVLIADMPELGKCNKGEIASLAGLAPMDQDSGRYRGQRHIRGGRRSVRKALYMAAMSAIRHNERIREFYQRLRKAGKPAKKALVACARKMLTILNQMLRTRTRFEEELMLIAP